MANDTETTEQLPLHHATSATATFNAEQLDVIHRFLNLGRVARLRQLAAGTISHEECHRDLARAYEIGRLLGAPPDAAWEPPIWMKLPARKRRGQ